MSSCHEGKEAGLGESSKETEEKKKKLKEPKAGGQEDILPPNDEQDGEVVSSDRHMSNDITVL